MKKKELLKKIEDLKWQLEQLAFIQDLHSDDLYKLRIQAIYLQTQVDLKK